MQLTKIFPPFMISICISTIIPSLSFHGTGCSFYRFSNDVSQVLIKLPPPPHIHGLLQKYSNHIPLLVWDGPLSVNFTFSIRLAVQRTTTGTSRKPKNGWLNGWPNPWQYDEVVDYLSAGDGENTCEGGTLSRETSTAQGDQTSAGPHSNSHKACATTDRPT